MEYQYQFKVIMENGEILFPKGFYYQDKYVILVGCMIKNHTIRRKENIKNVKIIITESK